MADVTPYIVITTKRAKHAYICTMHGNMENVQNVLKKLAIHLVITVMKLRNSHHYEFLKVP